MSQLQQTVDARDKRIKQLDNHAIQLQDHVTQLQEHVTKLEAGAEEHQKLMHVRDKAIQGLTQVARSRGKEVNIT